jgi:Predicted acetyltransferase
MLLANDEIFLKLIRQIDSDPTFNYIPIYYYGICSQITGEVMGYIDLRMGYNEVTYYGGNIGYKVFDQFQGNHYAAKACLVLFEQARQFDMSLIIITCNPENLASRKTCEYVGGKLEKIVNLPPHSIFYKQGDRRKCIYRVKL